MVGSRTFVPLFVFVCMASGLSAAMTLIAGMPLWLLIPVWGVVTAMLLRALNLRLRGAYRMGEATGLRQQRDALSHLADLQEMAAALRTEWSGAPPHQVAQRECGCRWARYDKHVRWLERCEKHQPMCRVIEDWEIALLIP